MRLLATITLLALAGAGCIGSSSSHIEDGVHCPQRAADPAQNCADDHLDWPLLWDCDGRGFGRIENPTAPISARTINGALDRGRDKAGLQVMVTAHVARHTYCTNWIKEQGSRKPSMEKLSRQVGTSVAKMRNAYVHVRCARFPSRPSTSSGTSLGDCVTKKTPTPFERMRRTV